MSLPDCMMPDGAEPCTAFQILHADNAELRAALAECIEAFEFTRQYVGYEMLPPIKGWSWFDAVTRAQSALNK